MISVVDRLVESWLDSQGERRYQPAFIQLLVSEGWTVLHNTRHSPIELGKDVIARDPNGVLYCFQLKGNPGGRVTKTEARDLLPQVLELIELPAAGSYRKTDERHVAVFVTNGTVDEEAELVFSGAGARTASGLCPASRFEILGRGELLARFVKTARQVWPADIDGVRAILNLMAEDGRTLPDPARIGGILKAVSPPPPPEASQALRNAQLSALLLMSEIMKAPWQAAANHYGLFAITVLTAMHALRFSDDPKRLAITTQYASLALEHASDLILEAKGASFAADEVWAEHSPLEEFDVMRDRGRMVADAAATLLIARSDLLDADAGAYAQTLVSTTVRAPMIWGMAAVPAFLLRWWAFEGAAGSEGSQDVLVTILAALCRSARGEGDRLPLPGPYYTFLDVWAFRNGVENVADAAIFEDNFLGRITFARAMLQILARRGAKVHCQAVWPMYSELNHEEPDLPPESFFDAERVLDAGGLTTTLYEGKTWNELRAEAEDTAGSAFLSPFETLGWLVAAYVALAPYRAWTPVLMWLDRAFRPAAGDSERIAAL